jgi:hypothetical protein
VKATYIVSIVVVILAVGILSTTQPSSESLGKKYDGTKGTVSIWFDHCYNSQISAINNMTSDGFFGGILVVVQKANTNGYCTWNQLHSFNKQGWEIISHSEDHKITTPWTTKKQLTYEIIQSKIDLQNQGFIVIIYESPYTAVTTASSTMIGQNYKASQIAGCRQNTLTSIKNDGNNPALGYNFPKGFPVLYHCGIGISGSPLNTFDQVKAQIDSAISQKTWILFNFHQIDKSRTAYHTPPALFTKVLNYIKQQSDAGKLQFVRPDVGLGIS